MRLKLEENLLLKAKWKEIKLKKKPQHQKSSNKSSPNSSKPKNHRHLLHLQSLISVKWTSELGRL